ncbi:MAG: PP2C family serine/threonine-protein phosphatase [Bryobacteraceae bacterium]
MFGLFEKKQKRPVGPPLMIRTGLRSDPGCERDINEDTGRIYAPADPDALGRKGVLAVVADGMGGHEAGEVASRLAVETIGKNYYDGHPDPPTALRVAFQKANSEILMRGQEDPKLSGMGTTCTALAILSGGQAFIGHVGDSRSYLIRGGGIYHLTEDDSQVMELVRRGLLSLEEARNHEDRNILLRALGRKSGVSVSAWEKSMSVTPGDCFVLCTDGLHDLIADEEIMSAATEKSPDEACQSLVDLARFRGGFDNITVAILAVAPANGTTKEPTA